LQTNAGKLIADDHKLSYTKLPLIVFGKLHGKYTLRLYEILSKNVYKKIIRINIFDLFKMLNIEGSYCNYKFFNRDILRVAHLEINDKSNLTFSYEMCKVGKSVTSITFHISNKNILKAIKQVKDELISIGITIIGINDIFENRHISHEIVRRNLDYVRDKLCRNNNIRNIASYAYTAIINNYAGNTKKDSDTATEAYIKKERQVPVDEVLRNAHAQVEEHKKKIELAIRAHLKDKHAKEVVQTYILDNAGELTMHVLHKNINVETVTIDELLSNPSIYQIISSYMLDNKIIQVESLDNFLQTNCWKIDQLDLLNNALI
jgi:plasmid replication initiation protein